MEPEPESEQPRKKSRQESDHVFVVYSKLMEDGNIEVSTLRAFRDQEKALLYAIQENWVEWINMWSGNHVLSWGEEKEARRHLSGFPHILLKVTESFIGDGKHSEVKMHHDCGSEDEDEDKGSEDDHHNIDREKRKKFANVVTAGIHIDFASMNINELKAMQKYLVGALNFYPVDCVYLVRKIVIN